MGRDGRVEVAGDRNGLRRTVERRPDLIDALDVSNFSKTDRNVLWELGYAVVDGRAVRRGND